MTRRTIAAALVAWVVAVAAGGAQTLSHRTFVEVEGGFFPQASAGDDTRAIADGLLRGELSFRPSSWLQIAGGFDLRANSHDQVEERWRLDVDDRTVLRPRASLRRLTATLSRGGFSVDIGKQVIRWARADVLNPIDRFAPRDFVNVIDTEFLGVAGVRPSLQVGSETFEAVWVRRLTPSRMPLIGQRWTPLPAGAEELTIVDGGSRFPGGAQSGLRWRHTGARLETGLSYFYGYNHLPQFEISPGESSSDVLVSRTFPRLRMVAVDTAVPTSWFSLKAEGAYFRSGETTIATYGLYVAEVERQAGEWLLTAGYAGKLGNPDRMPVSFDPERGLAGSIVGRASYTIDPQRSFVAELAVRQNGDGLYVKAEYSHALGQHWRASATGVYLSGREEDFLGQFRRNSHATIGLRFNF